MSEDAHECVGEETMGDIDPTEVISVSQGEKVRDFRDQKQYIDAGDLLPVQHGWGKSNTSTRARAHGAVCLLSHLGRAVGAAFPCGLRKKDFAKIALSILHTSKFKMR